MLRALKLVTLRIANALGVPSLLMRTNWRRQRLLILCYHGVSLDDEHFWNPDLYVTREFLRQRLRILKELRAGIIPLDEGVQALYAGRLPERSVVLTFDDGMHDFYQVAYPLLHEFQFPATVYLTSYYSHFNRPVFDVMCSYLLWKGRGRLLRYPAVFESEIPLNDSGIAKADRQIKAFALRVGLSGYKKDELLGDIAAVLDIDYEDLCSKRILHLMAPEEVAAVARGGIDIQLHTHRHRVSIHRDRFLREIDENRAYIDAYSSSLVRHFCYPGGFHLPQFVEWLRERGIVSSTTCEPGLASTTNDPMLLPRLVDHTGLTLAEFSAWISGLGSLLPRRAHIMSEGQLLEEAA